MCQLESGADIYRDTRQNISPDVVTHKQMLTYTFNCTEHLSTCNINNEACKQPYCLAIENIFWICSYDVINTITEWQMAILDTNWHEMLIMKMLFSEFSNESDVRQSIADENWD